jgi:hypothetical protein
MADTTQTYKIEITIEADVEKDGHPRDWIDAALEEGHFKYSTLKIYGTDITPLDKEDPLHKWIKDFK